MVAYPSARPTVLGDGQETTEHSVDVYCVVNGRPRVQNMDMRQLMILGKPPSMPAVNKSVITCHDNTKGFTPFKLGTIVKVLGGCSRGVSPPCQLYVKFDKNEPAYEVQLGVDVLVVDSL